LLLILAAAIVLAVAVVVAAAAAATAAAAAAVAAVVDVLLVAAVDYTVAVVLVVALLVAAVDYTVAVVLVVAAGVLVAAVCLCSLPFLFLLLPFVLLIFLFFSFCARLYPESARPEAEVGRILVPSGMAGEELVMMQAGPQRKLAPLVPLRIFSDQFPLTSLQALQVPPLEVALLLVAALMRQKAVAFVAADKAARLQQKFGAVEALQIQLVIHRLRCKGNARARGALARLLENRTVKGGGGREVATSNQPLQLPGCTGRWCGVRHEKEVGRSAE
jgi:hypothetical protein